MPSTQTLFTAAAICFLVALAVPTAAITVGEDPASDDVTLTPIDDRYATIEGGQLSLDINVYDHAKTEILEVFTIEVGEDADTIDELWIDHDVAGVSFYADGTEVTPESRLEPDPGETITVGVTVETPDAVSSDQQFSVHVSYEDEDADTSSSADATDSTDSTDTTDPADSGQEPPGNATLAVTSASVSPTTIAPGESTTVTATVENTGTEPGTMTTQLVLGGAVVDTQDVALDPGESTTVSFEQQLDEPGGYTIAVNDVVAGTVTVTDDAQVTIANRSFSSSSAAAAAPAAALGLVFTVTGIKRRKSL